MTLSAFVGATAPVDRDTSLGEERPGWVNENTRDAEFSVGLPLLLEAVGLWCYHCGAPFVQFSVVVAQNSACSHFRSLLADSPVSLD